jgi:hypothetical protein
MKRAPGPLRLAAALLTAAALAPSIAAANDARWQVIGRQGLVHFVVVPVDEARNQGLYEQVVTALCEPERTCFVNFYTNSTGATPSVPLPDAIAHEATATFRRSAKNGVTIFMWSCRMKVPDRECF